MECNCTVVMPGPSVATCGGSSIILFMAILEHFLHLQCDIEDPCERIEPIAEPQPEYDFIVVGGGSAGSVVANRLSEVGKWRVLLVEAGVNEPTGSQVPSLRSNFLGSSIDWQYWTEPEEKACLADPKRRCYWPRGKVVGGSSVLNGMIYLRGSRNDYDTWEDLGNNGWSYENVLPYFLKSENNLEINEVGHEYHSVGGYLPVTKFPYHPPMAIDILSGAKELGHNVGAFDDAQQRRFAIVQTTSKNGIRHSAARSFLRPVKKRTNLDIMLNTTVAKILVEPTKKVAYGIEIITGNGIRKTILTRKEVIVCGGSVNSPQILLLSGIGSKDELKDVDIPVVHSLPGVGKNLHDHVAFLVKFTVNEAATNDLNYASALQYLLMRNGPLSATGLSQLSGFIDSSYWNTSAGSPDLQILFFGYSASCSKSGLVGEIVGKVNGTLPRREVIVVPVVVHPKSRGFITLRDKNPLSHPKIFANYLTESIDLKRLVDGVRFSLSLSKTKALKKYGFKINKNPARGCETLVFGSDEYWECAIRANTFVSHHQVGSCKMGPARDPMAVVDPELRVHGMQGLRVIDASIMPKAPTGNTYIPTIMIAEKGSDLIKKSWLKHEHLG